MREEVGLSRKARTSHAISGDPSCQAFQPIDVGLCLLHSHRVAFLKNFVYRDQGFKGLYLIRKYWLPVDPMTSEANSKSPWGHNEHFHARPERLGGLVIPRVNDTSANMFS